MGKYLSIAQKVPRQNEPGESTECISAVKGHNPKEWQGQCGSSACAGCYDVGEHKRIHPPKIGEDYLKWLERWKPRGKMQ